MSRDRITPMNILIIDDQAIVRRTLQRYIEHRGDTAYMAENGHTGLAIVQEHPIDLVITDVRMPDIDGLEVLAQIRKHHPEIPVIMVTGYADTDMAIQAVNAGAFAFLQKPILSTILSTRIDEALADLNQRRQENENLKQLEEITIKQRHRIAEERAFNAIVLHNIPFPVCLIDQHRRIHMTNEAFRHDFTQDRIPDEDATIDMLIHGSDQHRFPINQVLTHNENADETSGLSVEVTVSNADRGTDQRHYYATAFAVQVEDDLRKDLTCLFLQDHTLQVELEREKELQAWCLNKVYEFRAETGPLVHSAKLLPRMGEQLSSYFEHFQPTRVELNYDNQHYTSGETTSKDKPYISMPIVVEDAKRGALKLFADSPNKVVIQREFIDQLVETIARRFESRDLQLQLIQSSQLRALGEMAAGVAHELNQPLSGIRTFAEGILFGMKNNWEIDDGQIQSSLEDIIGQVDRMTNIIDHMRTFSRDRSKEAPISFRIDEVFENVFKLVHNQLQAYKIEVNIDLGPDQVECRGWPQELEQVFLNLITNARQAMDERVAKERSGELNEPDWSPRLDLVVRVNRGQNRLVVDVIDNGGGIPEAFVDNVFEPFFTSKEAGKGTGLGLSISHSIVQKHGGHISIDNRPGNGITFSVHLPIA